MMHLDLIVSRDGIHEGYKLMVGHCFDKPINMWEWKTAFLTCLVEGYVVDANSPLPVYFYNYGVGESVGVFYLANIDPTFSSIYTSPFTFVVLSGPSLQRL